MRQKSSSSKLPKIQETNPEKRVGKRVKKRFEK